jgi:hypothetical protein
MLTWEYLLTRTTSKGESISGDADAVDSVQFGDQPMGRRNVVSENDW